MKTEKSDHWSKRIDMVSDEVWGSNMRAGLEKVMDENRHRVLSQFTDQQLLEELLRRAKQPEVRG